MEKKKISLEVVNQNAAGIDIGSRSHWVAVGQNAEDVKEFGVYSEDQIKMAEWLKLKDIQQVDLLRIEGVNESTIMVLMSEVGLEGIKKFETAKQFASWLRLAPNNKISGGRVLSHHLPKGSSRLKLALRHTANAIGLLKEGILADFFKRISYKKGRAVAISALSRKLAVIIWNMISKGQAYSPPTNYLCLDEKRKLGIVKRIRKTVAKFGLKSDDFGFATI